MLNGIKSLEYFSQFLTISNRICCIGKDMLIHDLQQYDVLFTIMSLETRQENERRRRLLFVFIMLGAPPKPFSHTPIIQLARHNPFANPCIRCNLFERANKQLASLSFTRPSFHLHHSRSSLFRAAFSCARH